MQIFEIKAENEMAGTRIDVFLAEVMENQTRNSVQRFLDEEKITVNGKTVSKSYKIKGGESIFVTMPPPKSGEVEAQNIPLEVVYEDNDLLVVNKPKGMVVHPAAGNEDGTLVNALLWHCGESLSGIGGVVRPGIVHRIDKDTSGLLVVAKNDNAHRSLSEQIKAHSVTRLYHGIVYGRVKEDAGTVDAPIGRHPRDRKKMCVTERNAREAVTHFEVIEHLEGFTYLALKLETGRTHQIRVHMAYKGFPIAGDPVYGPKRVITSLDGQCLHAKVLGFVHPVTGEYMEFESPLPEYFAEFIRKKKTDLGED